MPQRIVLHVDFDYFYAQCEEVRNPELKIKPVCVCVYSGRDQDSGAVATANYLARRYGARSGMPIRTAMARLRTREDAEFLPTDFDYYSDVSERAMGIMRRYADVFEYVGKDEAYLDVTGRAEEDYGVASHLAQQIKNDVRGGVKLTCSVGVSPNKLVSKIASDHKKPDGLTVIRPDMVPDFLRKQKVRDIPGIGRKAEKKLAGMGATTVEQLREMSIFRLCESFGRKNGTYMYDAARGEDCEPVAEREPRVQFSRIVTLKEDSKEFDSLHRDLMRICGDVHRMVQDNRVLFRSVGIQFIHSDLTNRTKSKTLKNPTSGLGELGKAATSLLRDALEGHEKHVRRLGVRVSEFSEARGQFTMDSYF